MGQEVTSRQRRVIPMLHAGRVVYCGVISELVEVRIYKIACVCVGEEEGGEEIFSIPALGGGCSYPCCIRDVYGLWNAQKVLHTP